MRGDTLTKPTIAELLDQQSRSGTVIQPGPTPADPDVNTGGLPGWVERCRRRGERCF
jgi:hypothetical protein